MKKNIREKIYKILCKELIVDSVKETDYLLRDLGADSFTMVEICLYLEDEFNIDIPEEQIIKFETVRDVVKYVEKKVGH